MTELDEVLEVTESNLPLSTEMPFVMAHTAGQVASASTPC